MPSIPEVLANRPGGAGPLVLSDFSPPRGADPTDLAGADLIAPDYFCVAYAPGRAARPDPVAVAIALKERTGRQALFNLATRDHNALALTGTLLGAHLLGLRDVVVLRGDDFSARDAEFVKPVRHLRPTDLIRLVARANEGFDLRGLRLRGPTTFGIGATIDLSKGIDREAALARKKVEAGASFFITQPIYDPADLRHFREIYAGLAGPQLPPIIVGLDVPIREGVTFSSVPEWVQADLAKGRSGADIALEVASTLRASAYYVVPPILKGGARDYASAGPVIEAVRQQR